MAAAPSSRRERTTEPVWYETACTLRMCIKHKAIESTIISSRRLSILIKHKDSHVVGLAQTSALQASLRQPRNQPYRLHNRGLNYYKYRLLSIVNRTSVFSKIIFLIQHMSLSLRPPRQYTAYATGEETKIPLPIVNADFIYLLASEEMLKE
jgi:hypothetical protein